MRIDARLKRLEKAAGVGERCLTCRVHYIRFGDEIRRTAPADLYVTPCSTCKRTLKLIHSGYTDRERSVLIFLSSGDQSNPVKWLASYAWMQHHPRFQEIEEIGKVEEKRLRGLLRSDNWTLRESARKQVKFLDEDAAHKKLQQEALEKRKQRTADDEKEEKIFAPVLVALDAVRKRQDEIEDHDLFCYHVMAELEVFIWGEKSAEILKLIEDRQHQLAEEEARRKREAEEKERKYQEEKRMREEERKRQNEEYLARQRSTQPVPPVAPYLSNEQLPTVLATPPPDDGTSRYQHKLAYWRQTSIWMPDEW